MKVQHVFYVFGIVLSILTIITLTGCGLQTQPVPGVYNVTATPTSDTAGGGAQDCPTPGQPTNSVMEIVKDSEWSLYLCSDDTCTNRGLLATSSVGYTFNPIE